MSNSVLTVNMLNLEVMYGSAMTSMEPIQIRYSGISYRITALMIRFQISLPAVHEIG